MKAIIILFGYRIHWSKIEEGLFVHYWRDGFHLGNSSIFLWLVGENLRDAHLCTVLYSSAKQAFMPQYRWSQATWQTGLVISWQESMLFAFPSKKKKKKRVYLTFPIITFVIWKMVVPIMIFANKKLIIANKSCCEYPVRYWRLGAQTSKWPRSRSSSMLAVVAGQTYGQVNVDSSPGSVYSWTWGKVYDL